MSGDTVAKSPRRGSRTRSVARKLAMQALYQWQLTGDTPESIHEQFLTAGDHDQADAEYFAELLRGSTAAREELEVKLASYVDRPLEQLDPVERAILLIGLYELTARLDVPYKVTINEAVDLAKRFGATDGHKYVNAILDRAAREIRGG
jgi:N utilization substance protein B